MTKPRRALHIELVPLTAEDLPAATELSRAVRWPHRLEDWQFVRAIGDGLTARVEGRFAGTAMSWAYEQTVTRVGMVLVDPEFQRAGIGRSLMSALLDRISAPAIMLNATDAGEALYNSLGFIEVATIIQHQGTSAAVPLVSLRAGERIRPLGRCDAMRLVELDAAAQGVQRTRVIAALIDHAESVVLEVAGDAAGFAFCRRFGRGLVIGPVVAPDARAAQALLAHWIGLQAGTFVRIDVPVNCGLSPWLDGLGLVPCDQVKTMCRGTPPRTKGQQQTFALVNQALG